MMGVKNSNLSETQKETLGSLLDQITVSSTTSFNSNLSSLRILQGFINSNITTPQLIPSLKTDAITFNGYPINNVFLPRTGGSLSGSIVIDRSTAAPPSIGNFGNIGDRTILKNGAPTSYPYSVGIGTDSLWHSVPTSNGFDWYSNAVKSMSLSNNVLNVFGTTKENDQDLINKYTTPSTVLNVPNLSKNMVLCSVALWLEQ